MDLEIFTWWVQGITFQEAAKKREPALFELYGALEAKRREIMQLNAAECAEQYQNFEWLTPYLNDPPLLTSQTVFQLQNEQAGHLIELYYR